MRHQGLQVRAAAHAWFDDDGQLQLDALIGHPSGEPSYRVQASAGPSSAEELEGELAERLLAMGGAAVLEEVCGQGIDQRNHLDHGDERRADRNSVPQMRKIV